MYCLQGGNGPAAGLTPKLAARAAATPSAPAPARKPLPPGGGGASPAAAAAAAHKVGAGAGVLAEQLAELRVRTEGFEKEKDFYYSKLRDIELLCQTPVINEISVRATA